ncbi:uroporphyrinogen-III C-methyltransferase [Gemmobacter megaterium]|uniref:uroporphyrinogen-III C-methyltransferase n=1 Tax=Gemmobacter megaterium TaxID=1086013 RepID=A0A1N7JX31_9RHOB|nr:uroporphyrinogen-III C-methyltransferase [Gemmobacter megaterium]SIS53880.1 uroporphyrinogen-III C-methyltransferase [Gemmobacter megaterium]
MTTSFAPGTIALVGAGPGDPDLLTLRALRAIRSADVIVLDRLIGQGILDLIPDTAQRIDAGKEGFGPSTPQAQIHAAMIGAARDGARVVRLKSGDPGIFGRLEEELDALDAAGIAWQIVPGLTAASAAAATLGQPLTARGRNGALTILTGHDVQGFADQDWRGLARPGAVAAIYMGKAASRYLQGRLMMHGAPPDTPVTLVENASRPDQRIHAATLATLPATAQLCSGPAVILWGLAPRAALSALPAALEA